MKLHGDRIVIGSDTMVIKEGKIYEKPKNNQSAKEMIKELQGGKHEVITSICVLIESNGEYKEFIDYDKTYVYIKNMSNEEIDEWIQTGECLDKAGAYAIQGNFSVYVEKIDGNYTTVVGLPIHKLYEILKSFNINTKK